MARCRKQRCLARDSFRNNFNNLMLKSSPPKGGYRARAAGTAGRGRDLLAGAAQYDGRELKKKPGDVRLPPGLGVASRAEGQNSTRAKATQKPDPVGKVPDVRPPSAIRRTAASSSCAIRRRWLRR